MKKLSLLLLLTTWLFALGLSLNISAEEINSLKTYPVDNPLSYQSVRAMTQDKEGFMWFGSQEGLQRYDGHTFLSFHHETADKNSLSSGAISALLIDSSQRLWVGTRGGGLNLYREDSQDFQHITTQSGDFALSDDNVNALIEDSEGNIWVGTENGLNILFTQDDQWQSKQIIHAADNPFSLPHNSIQTLLLTKQGTIWVGTNGGGIAIFDQQGNLLKQNLHLPPSQLIYALHQEKDDTIWIGTFEAGVIKYNVTNDESGDFVHYPFDENNPHSISSNSVNAIFQDSNDQLWIATDKGLSIYNRQQDNFYRLNHSIASPYSLANDVVLTFFEDNSQMVWIGTFSGVNRWNPNMTTFNQYNSLRYPTLASNNITRFSQSISEDSEHQLFFSTYSSGIYQLSLSEDKIIPLSFNDTFKDLRIMTLFAEPDTLWVGTRSKGLYKVDLATEQVTNYQNDADDPTSLSANSVTDIIKDDQGNLWVSTYQLGINKLNDDGSFTRFNQISSLGGESSNKGPSSNHVLQILQGQQGYLWLATYGGGINRFDPTTKTFVHLSHDNTIVDSLSSDLAWYLFQDNQQNLWVGTQAAGLNVLSKENQNNGSFAFSHLDVKDGMKSRTVYAINQDGSGNIWFSSNKGISRYSPKHQSFKHFDTTHGLLDLEYNHGALAMTQDNTLYFGSAKGFTSVNPDNILSTPQPPQVRLTNILKLNAPMVFDQALSTLDSLTLEHSDQLISFDYVGLNYADPESTRYKYRLLGFDQQWIDAGKLRRATYTNLPAGSYQLQVIAANNDNIWSEPGPSLNIVVNPAPWQTWWAYLIYTILTALLLLTYSRLVNRKLLAEQQQKISLKQQVEEKTQEFQLKNIELEQANKQLENAATTDKLTGVNSRRYLDIYIEQASQLMAQIHQNILPVQRSILPRLYLLMVRIDKLSEVSNSQLINLTDLLLYSRNPDDLVIRWSADTFAVIGYEKDKNASELARRLSDRFESIFTDTTRVDMAYSFYPFNFEQPMALSWDQVSVITEFGLKKVSDNESLNWLGLYAPAIQPFNYLDVLKLNDISELGLMVKVRQG